MVVSSQWERLPVEKVRGTIMIIGASDTGKSTLAQYLFQQFARTGLCTAVLDADVGQSTLGLPTTLNLAMGSEPGDDRFPPSGPRLSYFVGDITPRGHMLPMLVGSHALQQKGLALGAEVVVVDTTGLVDRSQGGKALKQWEIELLDPALVVGLQRNKELEPILWPLRLDGRVRTADLTVSPHVAQRSRESRIKRRRECLSRYFQEAHTRLLTPGKLAMYDIERLAVGALVAFQAADGFTLGLGVVEEARCDGSLLVRTPLSSLDQVRSLRFGALRWDPAAQQEK
jgi:polynucleotide 5'-hydroxyl-kinase GRC3/NOL9